jgi:hypothetical protein
MGTSGLAVLQASEKPGCSKEGRKATHKRKTEGTKEAKKYKKSKQMPGQERQEPPDDDTNATILY